MSVLVASCTLEKLFSNAEINVKAQSSNEGDFIIAGRLAIPEYQRPYTWSDREITQLLETSAEHFNDQRRLTVPYYLGSLILHKQGGQLNVIDGQQRLTTLALIAHMTEKYQNFPVTYSSPLSQQRIKNNLIWLKARHEKKPLKVDFKKINVTLVVTESEDEAYRFFETQNTGGVRLSGPDIIKAHHLRAVDKQDKKLTNQYAARWEALGDLNPVVELLLKGRYWQYLNFRKLPTHRQATLVKGCVVEELSATTLEGGDVAFASVQREYQLDGGVALSQAQLGYALRQPLNAGINTIHYLRYFETLRSKYLCPETPNDSVDPEFLRFYGELVCQLDGCAFLKTMFDCAMLLYINQFGEHALDVAAKKIFRVVYSRRVSNQKTVKESSIPAFLQKEAPLFDWIVSSYTAQQCFERFDQFPLNVDSNNLGENHNGVKKRFVLQVVEYFGLDVESGDFHIDEKSDRYHLSFSAVFSGHISALGASGNV